MKELTNLQVNTIIGEYMCIADIRETFDNFLGREICYTPIKDEVLGNIVQEIRYTRSLDALIPVWKKLNANFYHSWIYGNSLFTVEVYNYDTVISEKYDEKDSISEAAAHATAKCILELKESK